MYAWKFLHFWSKSLTSCMCTCVLLIHLCSTQQNTVCYILEPAPTPYYNVVVLYSQFMFIVIESSRKCKKFFLHSFFSSLLSLTRVLPSFLQSGLEANRWSLTRSLTSFCGITIMVVVILPRNSTRNMMLSTDTCHVASG